MEMRFASVLTLAYFLTMGVSSAGAGNSASPKPDWQVSLSVPSYHEKAGLRPSVRPAAIFIGPGDLAVAYASAAPKGSRSAWEANLVVMSAQDGAIRAHKVFAMAGRSAGIFRSEQGKLVVWLGDRLEVLSPQTLLTEESREVEGAVQPYSDGKRIILLKSKAVFVKTEPQTGYVRGSGFSVSFVRLDTLETQAACDRDGLDIPHAIQGNHLANRITSGDGGWAIYLGTLCGGWKRISDLQGRPDFLSPDRLVVTAPPDEDHPRLTVITTTGEEVCSTELKKHSGSLEPAKPSLDGTRLAVRIHDLAGLEIPALDIYRHVSKAHITVYGVTNGACTPSLLDVETKVSPRAPSEFDLSFDGGHLVILGDGQVRMFRVP
jgi:hypothetical protein